jgi:uncharacterized Zn-finger protein
MSLSECQQIHVSPFLLGLDDDLPHLGNLGQVEPLRIEPSSIYGFEGSQRSMLRRYESTASDTRSSSLWSPQTAEHVQYQEDERSFFENSISLQGGSTSQWGAYRTRTPDPMAAFRHDELQSNAAVRAEPHRDTEAQPIKCFECRQPFDNLQSLDQHTKAKSHKGWRCSEEGCGKTYPRRDTLLRHQLKHSPKAHVCTECAKCNKRKYFARKDHLNEHIRKRHSPSTDDMRCAQLYDL